MPVIESDNCAPMGRSNSIEPVTPSTKAIIVLSNAIEYICYGGECLRIDVRSTPSVHVVPTCVDACMDRSSENLSKRSAIEHGDPRKRRT